MRRLTRVVACAAALALVTGAIELLKGHVPVLSLAVLYLLAIIPVAVAWGIVYATGHSIPARFPAARTAAYSFERSSGPPVAVANTSASSSAAASCVQSSRANPGDKGTCCTPWPLLERLAPLPRDAARCATVGVRDRHPPSSTPAPQGSATLSGQAAPRGADARRVAVEHPPCQRFS